MARVTKLAAAISQLINVCLPRSDDPLSSHPNETVSGRAYRRRNDSHRGALAYKWINRVFFWQKDHCFASHLDDRLWVRQFSQNIGRESGFFMPGIP